MFTSKDNKQNSKHDSADNTNNDKQSVKITDNRSVVQRMQYLWMLNPTGNTKFDEEIRLAKEHKELTGENFLQKCMTSPKVNQELIDLIEASGKKEIDPQHVDKISKDAHNTSAGDFSQKQKRYQVYLSDTLGLSKAQIMDYHQSAGYEFEFASYKENEDPRKLKEEEEILPSHQILSQSEKLSPVFDLPFRLETDSGNSLEVVTPPFLFLLSYIPKKVLSAVFDKYTVASNEINGDLKSTETPVNELGGVLRDKDFGSNWNPTGKGDNLLAIENSKHKSGAYGQINISMTSEDIVEFLKDLSTIQKKQSMLIIGDKSHSTRLLNEINAALGKSYEGSDSKAPGGFLLYSRYVANLLAIPSINLRQTTQDYHLKPDPNFATQIKESLGIWIKATPHEVILDYMKGIEDKEGFTGTILDNEEAFIGLFETYVSSNKGDIERWIHRMKAGQLELETKRRFDSISKMDMSPLKIQAAKEFGLWKKTSVILMEQQVEELFISWFKTSLQNIAKELHNLNGLIKSGKVFADTSGTKFLGEEFGSGMGVRKDTHLPSTTGEKRKTYVSEIRGKNELDRYEDNLEK